MNSFGTKFRVSLFGESHGKVVGVVLDGVPAGIELSEADFKHDLERREAGGVVGATTRKERDQPEIMSGLFAGYTTGAPLAIQFRNEDIVSEDYQNLVSHPRPSHADFVARMKYDGYSDYRGGGHFSGRLTLGLVVAGVVAKKMLGVLGVLGVFGDRVEIKSEIVEIGGERDKTKFKSVIEGASNDGDSVGGVVECVVKGVPVGWGEPFFDSIESVASHLLFSIPAIKGVEFGSGFEGAKWRGSQNNDPIISADGTTQTNHAGGVNGGISSGNPIVVRVAVKPTSSIGKEQKSYNFERERVEPLKIVGRHDACIALRVAVVVEAAMAVALVQFKS